VGRYGTILCIREELRMNPHYDNYRFPMTSQQRKEVKKEKYEFAFWFSVFSLIVGVGLGYAWRMVQGF
jgi:hypothetical protein